MARILFRSEAYNFFGRWVRPLLVTDYNIEIFNTPFQGLLMSVEKYIEASSLNDATPVENLYRVTVLVARNNHFGSKWVTLISSYKEVARVYFMTTGCYAI